MLTSRQRSILSSLASKECVVQTMGKYGPTEAFAAKLDELLSHHELVKVKFLDYKDEKREIAEKLAASTGAELVRIIGNNAIFYRQNPDPEHRRIQLDA
ncbi:MAG: YhbY family RNA-binding protein [Rectinemataceae bacterium]